MTSVADSGPLGLSRPDVLSGTARAHALDRWIYVIMAVFFIAIVLTGFIPDSVAKLAAIKAGQRLPFPLVLHVHAVLMGSFLLLLLAQTTLVATGRAAFHRQLGLAGLVLAPALVVVGTILAATNYHVYWDAVQAGQTAFAPALPRLENILLLQLSAGILFAVYITLALRARNRDPGFHKRMIFLATAVPLAAAIDRMDFLPTTFPGSPAATDFYILLVISPLFAWDIIRNKSIHRAYWVWLAGFVPMALAVDLLWDRPQWHAIARHIMGV